MLENEFESINNSISTPILNSEQLLINYIILTRKIEFLCHFTPRKNIESIKKLGLIPKHFLKNSDFVVTDPSRYDKYSSSICLSISQPNKYMFQQKQDRGLDLCLMLIDPNILFEKNCIFYPHNAATASYRYTPLEELKGEQALEKLFAETVTYQKSGREPQTIYRDSYLLDCETTSTQAEVQCLERIEPKYIMGIIEENIPLDYHSIKTYYNDFILSINRDIERFIIDNYSFLIDSYPTVLADKEYNKSSDNNSINKLPKDPSIDEGNNIKNTNITKKSVKSNNIDNLFTRAIEGQNNVVKSKLKNLSDVENEIKIKKENIKDNIPSKKITNSSNTTIPKNKKSESFNIDKYYSSGSSAGGDGCLEIIIVIILVLIFIF